jgi:hypothetical protein
VIEHFTNAEYLDVLARWVRILEPGGEITLSGPDVTALTTLAKDGEITAQQWARQCFDWTNEELPKEWKPPPWATGYWESQEQASKAIEAVATRSDREFVEWFRDHMFPVSPMPKDWYWVHKSAHSQGTISADLRDLGIKVDIVRLESEMYFAVHGRKS